MLKLIKAKVRNLIFRQLPGFYWFYRGRSYYKNRDESVCEKLLHDEICKTVLSFQPARVLEYGVGNGSVLNKLLLKKPDLAGYGIDISRSQIGIARKNAPNAVFLVSSLQQIDYPDDFFDVIYGLGVLMYLKPDTRGKSFHELYRVCGNYLVAVEYVTDYFSEDLLSRFRNAGDYRYEYDIKEALQAAGFEIVLSEKIAATWDPKINLLGEMPWGIIVCRKRPNKFNSA